MRVVSQATRDAWKSSFKGGSARPMFRATIQKLSVVALQYDLADVPANTSTTLKSFGGSGKFRSIPFGQSHQPIELPNLATVNYNKSIIQDIATCTLTLFNTDPLPLGAQPEPNGNFDRPGYFTFNRGVSAAAQDRWEVGTNGWKDLLVPDRLIRLYEGYGYNPFVCPEEDENLYPAGIWIIDDVAYTADGMISVQCRDIGRVLLDYICYPPIVPFPQYPLTWDRFKNVDNPDIVSERVVTDWFRPTYFADSNTIWANKGITDNGKRYVEDDGEVFGHGGREAFDSLGSSSFWLSVGSTAASTTNAFEWIQGKFSSRTISAVKVTTWGGPYTCYVSVYSGGAWQGSANIPYTASGKNRPANINNGSKLKYVKRVRLPKNGSLAIALPKAYTSATYIRLTFTDLFNSGIGKYKYRAGIKDVKVLQNTTVPVITDGGTHVEGTYGDYTDIVKWFLAWSGWYWPKSSTGYSFFTQSDGDVIQVPPPSDDATFGTGRVWGDFESTNASGPATLGHPIFDKKSIMDCIATVRDIVGFVFFFDETGGAVWRAPNIWRVGNYISGSDGGPNAGRTDGDTTDPNLKIVEIDERETLLAMTTKLTSRQVRERIFVGNNTGAIGALAEGFNPYPSGLERIGGWSDQYFSTQEECQVMADLIAVRSMFMYRTNSLTIPGNPSLQIDDQVRIFERVTNETYLHYVRGIECDWDVRTGRYTYNLETHWLGEAPFENWIVDPSDLSEETQAYLDILLGQIPPVVNP